MAFAPPHFDRLAHVELLAVPPAGALSRAVMRGHVERRAGKRSHNIRVEFSSAIARRVMLVGTHPDSVTSPHSNTSRASWRSRRPG